MEPEQCSEADVPIETVVLGEMCQPCKTVVADDASAGSTGIVYDPRMLAHESPIPHPEQPARIQAIWDALEQQGLVPRCTRVPARAATAEELAAVHEQQHIDQVLGLQGLDSEALEAKAASYNSVFLGKGSTMSAALAAGGLAELTLKVCSGALHNGAAVVRPPGHHCLACSAMGFSLFNNVAVATRTAQRAGVRRVLVVDFDVHHGNGTQEMFLEDSTVLFVSIHRYDAGGFYPGGPDGDYSVVGSGDGTGFNVNIPWPGPGPGDVEYDAAFRHVLLPVAKAFEPELVICSSGFDAAEGDPLGGCHVSPQGYYNMIKQIQSLADGKVIVALEGGYDLTALQGGMVACVSALLGDAGPRPTSRVPQDDGQVDSDVLKLFVQIQEQLTPHWPGIVWPAITEDDVAAAPRKLAAEAAAANRKLEDTYGGASEAAWAESAKMAQPETTPSSMCSVCQEFAAGADGMCSVCSRNAAAQ